MDAYRVSFDILVRGKRFWQELICLGQRTDKLVSSLHWNRLAGNLTPLWNKDTPESTVILNINLTILPKVSYGNKLTKQSKINTNPCQIIRKENFVWSPWCQYYRHFFSKHPCLLNWLFGNFQETMHLSFSYRHSRSKHKNTQVKWYNTTWFPAFCLLPQH